MSIIERKLMKKPQLGGWRNKITGITYLNADSQTGPPTKRIPLENTCSRLVQTVLVKDKECQPTYDQATQMSRKDYYISNVSDKYMTARPYVSYEEMQILLDLDGKARVIQKCYRAYRILKFIKECARIYRKMREECDRFKREKDFLRSQRNEAYCKSLNNPKTLTDIDALLNQYENFELEGIQDKNGLEIQQARRSAYQKAFEKIRIARESRTQYVKTRFLTRYFKPKCWINRKGKKVEMWTLKNQAAIDCWHIYDMLINDCNEDSKMEILLKARSSIEDHFCSDAMKFRELLDQEITLTSKDVDRGKCNYLRKRTIGAFLQFVKTSYNCSCKSIDENGRDYEFRKPLDKNQVFCLSCRKLLPRYKFPITSRKQRMYKCKACVRLYANHNGHLDLLPYERMLLEIRESELNIYGNIKTFADCMSSLDLRHLVIDIWHGHSALSECSKPRELRLPRYDIREPWSPWNCVLLTENEADAYLNLNDPIKIFSVSLRKRILTAHRTARLDFKGLVALEGCIDTEKIDDRQSLVSESIFTKKTTTDANSNNRSEDLIGHCQC